MEPEVIRTILLNECSSFDKNGFDKDIGLYISLIEEKKYKDASIVYEKRLIPRYPDELTRVRIIRYYRKRDIRFREIYAGAVRAIFEKIVASVKKLIFHISSIFESRSSNPYEILRKIDLALKVIPHRAKNEGFAFIDKMETYSVLLGYMPEKFSIAADILKRYFDNTLFVKVEVKESVKIDESYSYKKEEEKKKITIDLDKIVFSDEEIKMICINNEIKSRSFQVLAYCRQYWRQIFNHDFEKKIFLYSKKYNTNHFRIFQIIKNCRIKKMNDEVILLEIYSLLSNSYSYSLKEDLLMQKVWRQIRPADLDAKGSVLENSVNKEEEDNNKKELENAKQNEKSRRKEEAEGRRLRNIRYRTDAQVYSLHDRIQKFYHKEVFDAHEEFNQLLSKHIDKYLEKHWKKDVKQDPYILKGAAYIITTFITDNYNVVSPNWASSLAKREVTNIGFQVPEIESIIALCLEEIRLRRAVA